MSFKDNLKSKINLDRVFHRLVSSIKEPPGKRWVDMTLTRELLSNTDFAYRKVRNLDLYILPREGEVMEVLVLDNELPIYHTTVDDVALRKSPYWQQMFSIRNIRKIMNDHDVVVSKGKDTLERLHNYALARLDLTYNKDDLALLLEEARHGLEQESIERIQESFDLFFELLDFQPVSLGPLAPDLLIFAGPSPGSGAVPAFEHFILFNEKSLSLGLKRGAFSPEDDSDLAWIMQYAVGKKTADLQGIAVFEFLADLALEKESH
ncbi:MAG: hypothetical protein C4576_14675 [Desulfobacteraceae bacterium]|nr:MAG: hypothetical protein C4576_14675 [Desulfobacteraceae bacterium]